MTNGRSYRDANANSDPIMLGARLKHWTLPNERKKRSRVWYDMEMINDNKQLVILWKQKEKSRRKVEAYWKNCNKGSKDDKTRRKERQEAQMVWWKVEKVIENREKVGMNTVNKREKTMKSRKYAAGY